LLRILRLPYNPPMKVFLFSDSHFGLETRSHPNAERVKSFFEFLYLVEREGDRLILVGDIFDFWFEYRSVIPGEYFDILKRLSCLAEKIPVHLVTGNHDLWAGKFLEDLGMLVHPSCFDLEVNGHRFHLCHGDLLMGTDLGGKLIRKILENRVSRALYKLVHPDLGISVAKFFSKLSRVRSETKVPKELVPKAVHELFDSGYDGVILGHTHFPHLEEISGKIFMYIGDWLFHFTYGTIDDRSIRLVHFNEGKEQVLTFNEPARRGD
jgi:UDP-2,3-diacylglucosamine hydrolase